MSVEFNEYNEEESLSAISGLLKEEDPYYEDEDEYEETAEPDHVEVETEPTSLDDNTLVKVKINGEEKEVPLAELRNGYQRQADYTNKTQEIAAQRQELSQKEQEYNQFLQSVPMLAQVAQTNIQDAVNKLYAPEFIALAEQDPAQYIAEKAKLERVINQNQVAAQEMAQQYELFQKTEQERQSAYFEQQLVAANDILTKEVDGWADGSAIDNIKNYATTTAGFAANELNGLIDPRQVIVLNKARLYDEMIASQNSAIKKVKDVPSKSIRPGTRNTTAAQDEYLAERNKVLSTNNDRDIAALMSKLL